LIPLIEDEAASEPTFEAIERSYASTEYNKDCNIYSESTTLATLAVLIIRS